MKNQPEKENVLDPCLASCKDLKKKGIIIDYRRLDALDKVFEIGASDIEIHLLKEEWLWLLKVECKRDDGTGSQRPSQIKYENKYKTVKNVVYILVESVKEMEAKVEELTGHWKAVQEELKLFEFEPKPTQEELY